MADVASVTDCPRKSCVPVESVTMKKGTDGMERRLRAWEVSATGSQVWRHETVSGATEFFQAVESGAVEISRMATRGLMLPVLRLFMAGITESRWTWSVPTMAISE